MSDLRQENERLRRILDVARYMAVTNDLDALLGIIVEATCEVLSCERATIFLYDKSANELYSRVARGAERLRFPADRGIAGAAAMQRACVNVPDAYADARFNREVDRQTGFVTRNLLTFPLENLAGDLIGVLQALNKIDGQFGAEDEELARALSAQAGVALDRGRLLEEFAEKQRMEHDLEIARSIQLGFLPREAPQIEGYEVAGWNRSADQTGGDCFDFVVLPDGRLFVLLADATGHGIGAALVIAQARSLLRGMLALADDLPRIATAVNKLLAADLADERFVTAFVGILDPRRHELRYVSGGQAPLMLFSGGSVDTRGADGLPFAVIAETRYETDRAFRLEPGSTLALLTDGFFETLNAAGDQFGDERVVSLIQSLTDQPLTVVIERLHEAVQRFRGDTPQLDDLTAVLIRRQ